MLSRLRSKLIVFICVPLLVVYGVILMRNYRVGKAVAIADAQRLMQEMAKDQASQINAKMAAVSQAARTQAGMLTATGTVELANIQELLRSNLETNADVFGSCMAFEVWSSPTGQRFAPYVCRKGGGTAYVDIGADVEYDYPSAAWYALCRTADRPIWTEPYFDEGAGYALMCTYSAPFYWQGDGAQATIRPRFAGLVTADVALTGLRATLAEITIEGGESFLVSPKGVFISHRNDDYIMKMSIFERADAIGSPSLREMGDRMLAGEELMRSWFNPADGKRYWLASSPVSSTGWAFVTMVPEERVLAKVYRRLNHEAIIMLGGLVLIVGVIWLVASWLVAPIHRLSLASRQLAGGDMTVQVPAGRGRDEVSQLAGTFNQMVTDLRTNIEARIAESAAREAVERELQIARKIQESLLPMLRPPFPERTEFELHADNLPAKFMAGDFFDFWFVDDHTMAVVMADVSGKGVPAAMFMAITRTLLRTFTVIDKTPAEILTQVNEVLLTDNRESLFVTLFFGYYNVNTGVLTYANGGHNPPMLMRANGLVEPVAQATGTIVGVIDEAAYTDGTLPLGPGDTLVLFTDGVTEATDPRGNMMEESGFIEYLEKTGDLPIADLCDGIVDYADAFRECDAQDDITVLTLRRENG